MGILEQYRGARPPAHETANPSRARLRRLLDGTANTGGIRGDGDDQKGASPEHGWRRYQSSDHLYRRAVPGGCLNHGCRGLIMPVAMFATEPRDIYCPAFWLRPQNPSCSRFVSKASDIIESRPLSKHS